MPIGMTLTQKQRADIEFAGQTNDQRRKSMKRMSKVVEVDESQDIEKPRSNKKNAADDYNEALQNLESIA